MEPHTTAQHTNSLATWVNDAPTLEIAAQRYDQVIHHAIIEAPTPFTPRLSVHSR